VFGAHHVPESGGALIVSNHQSYLDPVLLSLALRRPLCYMARRSLFRNALFGALISALNAFPVTRGGRDVDSLREAIDRLKAGWCLVVFPEGTRTHDGKIGPIRPGVLAIARRAQVPVVPAVVEGAFEAWPRSSRPRMHPIMVGYGPMIRPEEYEQMSREQLAARLYARMLRLQSELKGRRRTED